MTFNSKTLWIERNSIEKNKQQIEDLLKYFKIYEHSRYEVYQGRDCLKITRALDCFKIIVDGDEYCIKLFGRNTFNKGQYKRIEKEKYRFIAKFEGDNAWYEVLKSLFANNEKR
jgi:hypothetical protein